MGLREIFQNAAKTAFRAAGNVIVTCIFHKRGYDADGQDTGSDAATISLNVLPQKIALEKVDNSVVLMTDRQYLVLGLDLGALVPEEDDTLEFPDGGVWTIKRVQPDEALATYLLFVRK